MKIQVMSDLHREFYLGGSQPKYNKDVDYIIMAGDIHVVPKKLADYLNSVADKINGNITTIVERKAFEFKEG